MGEKSFKDILWRIFRFVFLGFMALISVGPLVWIVMSSFKSNKEILSSAFALPTSLSFDGYKAALDLAPIFKFYGNSVVISFTSTLLNILIVSMAAYVLARYTFKGSTFITLLLSASLLVPTSALLMPIYKIMMGIGLFDTRSGLVLVYAALGLPTSLFVFKSYFQGIPKELEEAAYIDGATTNQVFYKIVRPIMKPIISTVVIKNSLWIWNDYFMPSLVLNQSNLNRTLTLYQYSFRTENSTNFTIVFAVMLLSILPIFIVYCLFQKQIVSGMMEGAVKG